MFSLAILIQMKRRCPDKNLATTSADTWALKGRPVGSYLQRIIPVLRKKLQKMAWLAVFRICIRLIRIRIRIQPKISIRIRILDPGSGSRGLVIFIEK
jgi:hypothetical protein